MAWMMTGPSSPSTTPTSTRVVGAENRCDQAILVNHAPGAVTPLDPELIEIGDSFG